MKLKGEDLWVVIMGTAWITVFVSKSSPLRWSAGWICSSGGVLDDEAIEDGEALEDVEGG